MQHSAATGAKDVPKVSFNNKYEFNINPPPIHEYWNYRNALVLIAIIPIYLAIGSFAENLNSGLEGYDGLRTFADSLESPMHKLKFAEPQLEKAS